MTWLWTLLGFVFGVPVAVFILYIYVMGLIYLGKKLYIKLFGPDEDEIDE